MRNIVLIALVLLMTAGGCITIDLGGSSKAPRVVKFEASPLTINTGEASILSWEVENASSVKIDPGMPSVPSIGTDKVAPAATTTYVLTASNKSGSITSQVQVTVAGSAGTNPPNTSAAPVITLFNSSPSSVNAGGSALLTWMTSNATGAKISGIGNVATNGSQMVYPSSTTTYIIEAYNDAYSMSASTTVTVVPSSYTPPASTSLPSIVSFSASPSTATPGSVVLLSWNILNASSASIDGYGPVPVTGSLNIYPSGTGTITFNLTATNSFGNSYASTSVSVSGGSAPPSASAPVAALYISPSSIAAGSSATLSWVTSGATSISINNGVKSLTGISGASGSVSVSPTSTTTYTLIATNAYGTTYSSQTLPVTASPGGSIPVAALYISPSTISSGGSATLSWVTSGASSINISNGIKSLTGISGASGSVTVSPTVTTTYTLTATNSYGSNYASRVLTVH